MIHVRCPIARTKKQALACLRFDVGCTVSDITSRWDGKPVSWSDLYDDESPGASVQIRYHDDRKVIVATLRTIGKASRDDLPIRKAAVSPDVRPKPSPAAAVDVYRECVIAIGYLDQPLGDAPRRWRDRLPLYSRATRDHRVAIDLGDVDELTIAVKARDAAYRLATADGKVPA